MNKFMEMAVEEARKGMNSNEGGPFGAVVVRDGKVIARAHNRVLKTNDPTAHAEILAIRQAASELEDFDLSGCEIYATSQPCPMCYSAIHWARIEKLHYGTTKDDVATIGFDDSFIYEIIKGESEPQVEEDNTDRDSCLELLDEWEKKPDKVMY